MQSCTNDFQCLENQYCDVSDETLETYQKCVTFSRTNPLLCYRSSDCDPSLSTTGKFCGQPGKSLISCTQCPAYGSLYPLQERLTAHNCFCGSSKFCNNCNGDLCYDCIPGYTLYQYECILMCPRDESGTLLDVVMDKEKCKCGQNICELGQKCTRNEDTYVCKTVVEDCTKSFKCKSCEVSNPTKCKTCIEGYNAVNGQCVEIENCINGASAVPNCTKCNPDDQMKCALCSDGYQVDLVNNACHLNSCQDKIKNCEICKDKDTCQRCIYGYIINSDAKQCVKSTLSCRYDSDCEQSKYCKITVGQCQTLTTTEGVCYRSTQCQEPNTYCKIPSTTTNDNCSLCPPQGAQGFALLWPRGCNCGTALNCRNCDGQDKCFDCVENFSKNTAGQCVKNCLDKDIALTNTCMCLGQECHKGEKCTDNGCDTGKATDQCKYGDTRIPHCVECQQNTKCAKCAEGFSLSTDNLRCTQINNCMYGDSAVQYCTECSTTDQAKCISCKSYANLEGGICVLKNCLMGDSKINHCVSCNPISQEICFMCEEGYLLSPDGKSCNSGETCVNDLDCAAGTYCRQGGGNLTCAMYDDETKNCYRSSQCNGEGVYCGSPGNTLKENCSSCEYAPMGQLNVRTCKCNDTRYCARCGEDGVCTTCITNYRLKDGQCHKICPTNQEVLTQACICDYSLCDSGKYCQTNENGDSFCVPSIITADCRFGASRVQYCSECKADDVLKCAACQEGYRLNEQTNQCTKINNCKYGDSKVENCTSCDDIDEKQCATCAESFYLEENKCKQATCMVGPNVVQNCIACVPATILKCKMCSPGYAVDLQSNTCVIGCSNDADCADNEYCNAMTTKCVLFKYDEEICSRTEQCVDEGSVCTTPGTTQQANCGKCASNPAAVLLRGCKCSGIKYCAICNTTSQMCATCLDGYRAFDGRCYKPCSTSLNYKECICGATICNAGYKCVENKCVADGNDCMQGSLFVEHCTKCSADGQKCQECAKPYDVIENACIQRNCLEFIKNCFECSQADQKKCQVCNDGFKLKDGKCKENATDSGMIIGISIGAALVILIIGGVVGYFLWKKKKVNGKVESISLDRKREFTEAPQQTML